MTNRPVLTLAHSADADDVFMWWPITGKVDPADPSRMLLPPAIETGRFAYRSLPEDIQALNTRAMLSGDLEITAISMATYAHVASRYALTACGSSFGEGYGPKLVTRAGRADVTLDWLRSRGGGRGGGGSARIAVPGLNTSAYLVLCILLGRSDFEPVPMRFDSIVEAMAGGQVDAGVLIHEAQITFADAGLRLLQDLGAWWGQHTSLPMPLGGNAVSRDLDRRFGPGAIADVVATLNRSLRHALENREESLAYAETFSPLKTRPELERYIGMYVSDLTIDAGERGRRAIAELLERAASIGVCPQVGDLVLLR